MFRFLFRVAFGLTLACHVGALQMDLEVDEGIPDTGLDTTTWLPLVLPPLSSMISLNDFQMAAKNFLLPSNYAEYRSGALDETTYINNLNIFRKVVLNGFSFQDVSELNLATTILGYNFSAPYFIAPAANAGLANWGAETNLVGAAAAAGILYVPSISSTLDVKSIGDAADKDQVMFHQAYVWSDMSKVADDFADIEAAGFKAIFLTVDNTGVGGVRDRAQRFTASSDTGHTLKLTIDLMAQIQNMTTLPIVPKGVKTAYDVKLCADLGFPAVYISNHGGRAVDGAATAVEILLEVRAKYPEVFDQIEIYADGGVRRGTHVLILLALGARAVGLGRSPMFANIFGQDGVEAMLDILNTEMVTEMQLLGQTDVDKWRGNTTLINTKKVEQDYFGAPL